VKIGLTGGACPRIQVVLHRREDLFSWHSPFSLGKRLIEKAIAKAEQYTYVLCKYQSKPHGAGFSGVMVTICTSFASIFLFTRTLTKSQDNICRFSADPQPCSYRENWIGDLVCTGSIRSVGECKYRSRSDQRLLGATQFLQLSRYPSN
jgi:hypothetical protein